MKESRKQRKPQDLPNERRMWRNFWKWKSIRRMPVDEIELEEYHYCLYHHLYDRFINLRAEGLLFVKKN